MERVLIPHACLVAILLVIRSSSGPNFVFHYPQDLNAQSILERSPSSRDTGSDGSSTISTSSPNSSDDEIDAPESGPKVGKNEDDVGANESERRSSYIGRQSR